MTAALASKATDASPATAPAPVRFRGRSMMALVLRPEPPLADWLVGLDALLGRSPGYFTSRPVVLDLGAFETVDGDLIDAVNQLATRGVRVMAIEGTDPALLGDSAGRLPPLVSDGRPSKELTIPIPPAANDDSAASEAAEVPLAPARLLPSLIVEKPVRSGQSVSFAEGDITILGSVASGAEIVAGGSIHIYGTLRGRAMAGFTHKDGRIFCSRLQAELLAIDGIYKTADEIDPALRGRTVQARVKGDTLVIASLS